MLKNKAVCENQAAFWLIMSRGLNNQGKRWGLPSVAGIKRMNGSLLIGQIFPKVVFYDLGTISIFPAPIFSKLPIVFPACRPMIEFGR